jgi:GMP synthase (glutamine-hydrolysing)
VVVHEKEYAELGTMSVELTREGASDEVFAVAGSRFLVHSGHEDTVVTLPREAVLLASSKRATNQALKLIDRPVYATQFHPELLKAQYLQRLVAYPRYVKELTGLSAEEFAASCRETPQANKLLSRFVRQVVQRIRD